MNPIQYAGVWSTQSLKLGAAVTASVLLYGCGGGGTGSSSANTSASSLVTTSSSSAAASTSTDAMAALPHFHRQPVSIAEPEILDGTQNAQTMVIPAEYSAMPTARLTNNAVDAMLAQTAANGGSAHAGSTSASPSTVSYYQPSQIRAAYNLPLLPNDLSSLSMATGAPFGAGQTIYIIDAQDNPNAGSDLNLFSAKFGLPLCSTISINSSTSLPIAAQSTPTCSFGVVYATSSGAVTSTAPSYSSMWASEIALDVEWAHAIAPLARIILIEATDSSLQSLAAAVNVANSIGKGIVSMSFGSPEAGYVSSFEHYFEVSGMSYVASSGDNGSQVNWPSVSTHVLSVGGTTLHYDGQTRTETLWSGAGGGVSKYVSLPSYQQVLTRSGQATSGITQHAVADVSMNADVTTGQTVAITAPGSSTPGWYVFGGTSMAAPMWAGIVAVINATRTTNQLDAMTDLHIPLYALYSGNWTSTLGYSDCFLDVTQGSNGTGSFDNAAIGYDTGTGIGSPNVGTLIAAFSS